MQVKGSMMVFVVKGVRAAGVEHFDQLLEIRSFDPRWGSTDAMISGWLERTVELVACTA